MLFVAVATGSIFAPQPGSAQGTTGPTSAPTTLVVPGTMAPSEKSLGGNQPTPFPLTTLAPLTGETSLPFPAYGTPVPGVNSGTPAPGISATVTLQQAQMVAFARSPALATARNDVYVEEAEVRLEQAGLLPLLSGAASYDYNHSQPGSVTSGEAAAAAAGGSGSGFSTSNSSTSAGFNLSLSQLIYDGGKVAAGVRAARAAEVSTADTYRRELQTVAFNVASGYYTYLADERTTQVDLEIVREDVVQLELVRAQVRAGTAAQSDIATVELPVAEARLAVVQAQGAELSAEAAFVNSMGLDANSKVQPIDDAPIFTATQVSSIPVPTYDVALQRAISLRPDYDAALQTVKQNVYLVRAAKLGLFPTLSAAGTVSDDSSGTNSTAFRNSQTIGLSLSIPIFDQGVTAANVASARANLNNAYAALQAETLTVQLNIKQALANLVAARAALDEPQVAYSTALINLRTTDAQYRAGVTKLPLLLNAEVGLTQALTSQVTAVYTLRQTEQTYLYNVGSNYDTSANNGKPTITPTPSASSQGGSVAARPSKKTVGASGSPPRANGVATSSAKEWHALMQQLLADQDEAASDGDSALAGKKWHYLLDAFGP